MKKSVFLLIVIMVSCMLNLTACGKEIVAEQPAPTTEPAITTIIESPDEGKETPAVEPTAEPEPTEEVLEPEPTVEPEPTEEPEPDSLLPELAIDVNLYFNEKDGFDFYNFGRDEGILPVNTEDLGNFGYSVNGWIIFVDCSPWRDLRAVKDPSNKDNTVSSAWYIRYPVSDDDITITLGSLSRDRYPLAAIHDIAYLAEWCKENPYSGEKPTLFSDRWIEAEEGE